MRVLIKGAGDLASGIGCRLHRCGFAVVMTDLVIPTAVRRTVAFSEAVYEKNVLVEDVAGVLCHNLAEIDEAHQNNQIAVVIDPACTIRADWQPDVLVDAILAKKNLGTALEQALLVIGVGPGFTAGEDCHCVVETKRGHYLGRPIWQGGAIPNTGIPGLIGGYDRERLIKAPCDGVFRGTVAIGAQVKQGDTVGYVGQKPVTVQIDGIVRGLLRDGVRVTAGMKSGDVDPRCEKAHCFTISDKAAAISGGVLEAILEFYKNNGMKFQIDNKSE